MGTVLAVLRDGKPVAATTAEQPALLTAPPPATDLALLRKLGAWRRWAEGRAAASEAGTDGRLTAHWRGLAKRLATLDACIESSHDGRLRSALIVEAERLLGTLARLARVEPARGLSQPAASSSSMSPSAGPPTSGRAARQSAYSGPKPTHMGDSEVLDTSRS